MCPSRPYHFKLFKGCLPQILLAPFLNTLAQIMDEGKDLLENEKRKYCNNWNNNLLNTFETSVKLQNSKITSINTFLLQIFPLTLHPLKKPQMFFSNEVRTNKNLTSQTSWISLTAVRLNFYQQYKLLQGHFWFFPLTKNRHFQTIFERVFLKKHSNYAAYLTVLDTCILIWKIFI